jgi:hypothetical protein
MSLRKAYRKRSIEDVENVMKFLKLHNIDLPLDILEFWARTAYVDDGVIVFDGPDILVGGYWEIGRGEPFYDDELKKALKDYLFNNNPNYSILVCPIGAICEIDKEGNGMLEFEVWDVRKDKPIFKGAVYVSHTYFDLDGYIETPVISIALEPL